MTVSEKHAEWISLLEVSGPFLAVSVLEDAFPQGLDKVETPFRQRIRSAYDEWRDAIDENDQQLDAIHSEWVSLVVRDFLEYDASVLRSGEAIPATLAHHDVASDTTFRPDFVVMAGDKARLLISVTAPGTRLDDPLPSDSWLASPAERLIQLCRSSGVPLGIVTNGERWMVVSAPADGGSSRASWYARLWLQEPVTLQAFYSLLGVRRCFGEESHTLDALIRRSLEHQDEITDTLGEQVRRAVEVLVQALDRADQDRNRTLLQDVTPAQLFEAGLTVMMRLVVLLCAEERKLLLLGEPVYDQNYAITTLRAQLVEQASHGLEILERRQDAWSRLLATFRSIYGGIHHETLRLPPLGGSLFDPDRFPFLEGRAPGTHWHDTAASPLPIDNRTVLLLLNALQVLEHKSGAQMLSYEALDVEQIGHVYEGLLERTVKRVPEVTLGLMANSTVRKKTGHPELPLSILEETARSGRSALVEFLNEKTGRSKSALTKDLELPLKPSATNRLLLACCNDLALMERVRPFGQLLRTDSWEDPLVYPQEAFIVTHGVGRRETGSHYTPKSLTEPIVQHTLEPLVYVGPAEGVPREEWMLKAPHEILALKVCDMAMGSGAFLVQSCRFLGDRLVEAWDGEEKRGCVISIEGVVLDRADDVELMPRDQAERVLIARRMVANRCLYGVDLNPLAVELAKLSLWLVTMMKGRPFSFLDHALKCGDSLLGLSDTRQLERFSLRDADAIQPLLETANLRHYIHQAAALRRRLEATPSHTVSQLFQKARLHSEAETLLTKLRATADFLITAKLDSPGDRGWETHRAVAASHVQAGWGKDVSEFQRLARTGLRGRLPFHWPLEFPEIFEAGGNGVTGVGFDAFVGNPPFVGGRRIRAALGIEYLLWLTEALYPDSSANADLCAFFFRRAHQLGSPHSCLGLIATNTIAQGDTQRVGLSAILEKGAVIFRATRTREWPGTAGVNISEVWLRKQAWNGSYILNGENVAFISPFLDEASKDAQRPDTLAANMNQSYQGSVVLGLGFVLGPDEALRLIAEDSRNRGVVFPYLTGQDLNTHPDQAPSRWVINFHDLPLSRKDSDTKYSGPYASDYPECLAIVTERVKPERTRIGPTGEFILRKPLPHRWWIHADKRPALYSAISKLKRTLVTARVSKNVMFEFVSTDMVFSDKVIVFPTESAAVFANLQSNIHVEWAWQYSSTMRDAGINYAPTDCFETFPTPSNLCSLEEIGEHYQDQRRKLMLATGEGLTKTYNRFNDPNQTGLDITELRTLHRQLDVAVSAAYGWTDLAANDGAALGHGFHETKQGLRYTVAPAARREILGRLLALNHERHVEESAAGLHGKKGGGKKSRKTPPKGISDVRELNLDFETAKRPTRRAAKEAALPKVVGRSSTDLSQTELLNAIFNCTARRESTDRGILAKEVATALGFQRLREKTRDLIASGFNSAIRRGLVGYQGAFIVRLAPTYADLELDTLVKAISATVRPGRVYTPYEVFYNAADHLGCKRLGGPFLESLRSALNAASRRGIITRRGDEVRKAD